MDSEIVSNTFFFLKRMMTYNACQSTLLQMIQRDFNLFCQVFLLETSIELDWILTVPTCYGVVIPLTALHKRARARVYEWMK